MQGERIITQLSSARGADGLTKRDLKRYVSSQYRANRFDQDFEFLLSNNVITQIPESTRFTLACPGVPESESTEPKRGDRVRLTVTGIGWERFEGKLGSIIALEEGPWPFQVLVDELGERVPLKRQEFAPITVEEDHKYIVDGLREVLDIEAQADSFVNEGGKVPTEILSGEVTMPYHTLEVPEPGTQSEQLQDQLEPIVTTKTGLWRYAESMATIPDATGFSDDDVFPLDGDNVPSLEEMEEELRYAEIHDRIAQNFIRNFENVRFLLAVPSSIINLLDLLVQQVVEEESGEELSHYEQHWFAPDVSIPNHLIEVMHTVREHLPQETGCGSYLSYAARYNAIQDINATFKNFV